MIREKELFRRVTFTMNILIVVLCLWLFLLVKRNSAEFVILTITFGLNVVLIMLGLFSIIGQRKYLNKGNN